VGALTMDLDLGIISEGEKRLKKKLILDYIYANLKHHNFWAYRYFFCELLALLNVVGVYGGDHAYYSYTWMYVYTAHTVEVMHGQVDFNFIQFCRGSNIAVRIK
jgi:hypothetical protein